MQKHFSAGSGTYYSDSIFFLSVAMHRIMPKGKAQLSCKHSLYMCAAWNAKLTDFHGKRLRHRGMVGGFCATQQAGAALTPQDVREGRTGAGLATCSRVFVMCVFTTSLPLGVSAERGATCCSTVRVLLARQCQQCGY